MAVVVLVSGAGLALWVHHERTRVHWPAAARADASVPGVPVTVGASGCGTGWNGGHAGRQTFALWNNSPTGLEVYLQDVATRKVFLDVEALGVAATRSVTTVLAPGRYRFLCESDNAGEGVGPVRSVTGRTALVPAAGLVPITTADLLKPVAAYRAWIMLRLPVLARQSARLEDDVRQGDLASAKQDWLTAHMTYATLGAAYGAFGRYDTAINGEPRTAHPATERGLGGFHKVEALLWSGAPAARAAAAARQLVHAVTALQQAFPDMHIDGIDLGLRAHEILEDAVGTDLNGGDDAGSHTQLATIAANITGTRQALAPLMSLLRASDPDLDETLLALGRSEKLVASLRRDGGWPALDALTRARREQLNASLDASVELLSQVAVITDPRPKAGQ